VFWEVAKESYFLKHPFLGGKERPIMRRIDRLFSFILFFSFFIMNGMMEGNNKIPMLHITEVILKFTKM